MMIDLIHTHWGYLVDTSRAGGSMDKWYTQLEGWYQAVRMKTGAIDEDYFGKVVLFIDGYVGSGGGGGAKK